jgi:hypothetical protein
MQNSMGRRIEIIPLSFPRSLDKSYQGYHRKEYGYGQ